MFRIALSTLLICLPAACALPRPDDAGRLLLATVDEDPSLASIALNGTRLHVQDVGPRDALPVIVLHGGPGNDFRCMLPLIDPASGADLSATYRFVFWDQRGTGLSRRHPPEEITLDAYVRDLEALVDHVAPGGRRVVLLGHSWGGAYAAQYIGAHPERVAGAMLVNPQALTRALYEQNPAPAELVLRAEWVEDALFGRTLLSPDDHASADLFLVGLFATSIEALTRYHNHSDAPLFRPGAAVFVHLNQRWDEDYDFTVGLDAYPREVLIAGSSDDEVLGYDFQRRQLGFFRAARLERIEGAGHIDMFTDRVSATVGLLEDYLGELAP